MTTSTAENPQKKIKPKGPIRWEAVIPFAVFAGLVFLYFTLFFDRHVRAGLQYIATQAYGAEINVGEFKTNFLRASLKVGGIQVTDMEQPERNIVAIEEIRLQLLWDAILRAKFVVGESVIENIQFKSPRKKPGRILPKEPEGPSATGKLAKQLLGNAKDQLAGNIFGDAAALLDGADPTEQLKVIQDELKTNVRINEIKALLKTKEVEWQQRFKSLPQKETFADYSTRIKALDFSAKDPAKLAQSVGEAGKILREAERKIEETKKAGGDLKNDVGGFTGSVKEIEELIRQDIADLQNRVKVPELDTKSIASMLFGPEVFQYYAQAQKYSTMARKYLPPPKDPGKVKTDAPPTPARMRWAVTTNLAAPTLIHCFGLKKRALTRKPVPTL